MSVFNNCVRSPHTGRSKLTPCGTAARVCSALCWTSRADARIQTWIAATGSFFQSYLRRALSNLAAEDVAGDGAQSLSTSTGAVAPVGTSASAPLRRDEERLESLKQMFGVPRDRG